MAKFIILRKMKIGFHGAAGTVTGSKHLIEFDGKRILLDCGLFQGKRAESDKLNRSFPFDPRSVSAVILSHAHLDHIGTLPVLVHRGFEGPIYCTAPTKLMTELMLFDSAKLMEHDALELEHPSEPLYSPDDVKKTIGMMKQTEYSRPVDVIDSVRATFLDAGHILGSSMVKLEYPEHTITFSGDLGRKTFPLLRDPDHPHVSDTLIVESTYGNREHEDISEIEKKLEIIVNRVFNAGGRIVIPSFAIGRTQIVCYFLKKLMLEGKIPQIPVYVDSPMATSVSGFYRQFMRYLDEKACERLDDAADPFGLNLPYYVTTVEQSKALNGKRNCIIVAPSGMCEHGRVLHHIAHSAGDSRNAIVIVGYQAGNTLGKKLVDGMRNVNILGRSYDIKCGIYKMNGMSAHAGKTELANFIREFKRLKNIFIVHGEPEQQLPFSASLSNSGNASCVIPRMNQTFTLE